MVRVCVNVKQEALRPPPALLSPTPVRPKPASTETTDAEGAAPQPPSTSGASGSGGSSLRSVERLHRSSRLTQRGRQQQQQQQSNLETVKSLTTTGGARASTTGRPGSNATNRGTVATAVTPKRGIASLKRKKQQQRGGGQSGSNRSRQQQPVSTTARGSGVSARSGRRSPSRERPGRETAADLLEDVRHKWQFAHVGRSPQQRQSQIDADASSGGGGSSSARRKGAMSWNYSSHDFEDEEEEDALRPRSPASQQGQSRRRSSRHWSEAPQWRP
eukprot:COSAG06_NODE_4_length_41837_cov_204.557597_32_plen_274_part_00